MAKTMTIDLFKALTDLTSDGWSNLSLRYIGDVWGLQIGFKLYLGNRNKQQ